MNCSEFNKLLDMYIDGEMDADVRVEFLNHAEVCMDCREKLTAAEQLRDFLSHMDEDVSVPLPAQAAWRNAIRAEAKRMRMKRIFTACGAVAAACVVTLGALAMLRTEPSLVDSGAGVVPMTVAMVESDGLSESAELESATVVPDMAMKRSVVTSQLERVIYSDDVQKAYEYLKDIITEYDGTIESDSVDAAACNVYLQLPGENAVDFINAVDHIGSSADSEQIALDTSAESLRICVVILKAD